MFRKLIPALLLLVAANGEARAASEGCELHVWPAARYGGVFFHAANGRFNGTGTTFDLVNTEVPVAADKAHRAFGPDRQIQVLVDSIKRSGKFDAYSVIVHEPLREDRAAIYANLLDDKVGTGGREIASSAPCYAEFHVTYITVFRSTLTKMLMTGFLVRYFPADPKANAARTIHSRPARGEERIGLTPFDFSTAKLAPQESDAVAAAFKFMADRFLRKKVTA